MLALLLAGCSSTANGSHDPKTALYDCIGKFDRAFRVERDQIYPLMQSAVEAGTRNPQDPIVAQNLRTAADQFTSLDTVVQATTCDPAAQDYQLTLQGISTGMKRAAAEYYDGFANHNNAQISRATQQISDVNAQLKHAVEITSPGARTGASTASAGR